MSSQPLPEHPYPFDIPIAYTNGRWNAELVIHRRLVQQLRRAAKLPDSGAEDKDATYDLLLHVAGLIGCGLETKEIELPNNPAGTASRNFDNREIKARLEYLRGEIEAECISYGELAELVDLSRYIEPCDVLLLQWAGVPESD